METHESVNSKYVASMTNFNLMKQIVPVCWQATFHIIIWVCRWRYGWLVAWFCYQLTAKPGGRMAAPLQPSSFAELAMHSWDIWVTIAYVNMHIPCWFGNPHTQIQYIPRNMHTAFALLCFVVAIHWLIFPYPSGLLHWHCGNLTIAPVPAKQPWWIWINTSWEFIMNDCISTTKQSTTNSCAYFLGYTVGTVSGHRYLSPDSGCGRIQWRVADRGLCEAVCCFPNLTMHDYS